MGSHLSRRARRGGYRKGEQQKAEIGSDRGWRQRPEAEAGAAVKAAAEAAEAAEGLQMKRELAELTLRAST